MADKEQQEKKKRIAAFLAPYRGKQGLVFLSSEQGGLGQAGAELLHELFAGNAGHAADFLGYSKERGSKQRSNGVTAHWAKFGLKAQGHLKVHNGLEECESIESVRERYRKATSTRELVPVVTWKLPKGVECGVCPCVCDLHAGPKEMDYARWEVMRDWIRADKSRRWMYLGDGMDIPTKNSPTERNYLSQDETERLLYDDFGMIADQCFAILSGNHEARLARETGVDTLDPLGRIAEKLGIYYGGIETGIRIRVEQGKQSQEYDGYIHHGVSGATTLGGQLAGLERAVRNFNIDFLAMGHTHARIIAEVERICLSRETEVDSETGDEWAEMQFREIVMAYAGSYLKHRHGGYSRNKLLSPANLGSISLHFYASRHSVHGRK
jgi:hypothetical protein